jgi:hypothetical protein
LRSLVGKRPENRFVIPLSFDPCQPVGRAVGGVGCLAAGRLFGFPARADGHANAHRNADIDAFADSDRQSNSNINGDSHLYAYGHRHCDIDADPNRHGYADDHANCGVDDDHSRDGVRCAGNDHPHHAGRPVADP